MLSRSLHSTTQMGHIEMMLETKYRPLHLVLSALLFAIALACRGEKSAGDAVPHEEYGHTEENIQLSQEERAEFGIELAVARPGTIAQVVELPGEVLPDQDRLAHIVPRFPGIVTKVYAQVGAGVRAGEVLAIIESNESLAPYELKTLTIGTVIEKHITRGEAVTRGSQAFVIADLGSVWVNLSVYQKDLATVAVGQSVTISAGHDLPETTGKISYITPTVDEETRTATARVVLSNTKKRWRPGMFVSGRVVVERTDVPLAVPVTTLQTMADQTVVFVEADAGFQARTVTTGRSDDRYVEIRTGLTPGERYVSHGGFTLRAELSREQFDAGHGH